MNKTEVNHKALKEKRNDMTEILKIMIWFYKDFHIKKTQIKLSGSAMGKPCRIPDLPVAVIYNYNDLWNPKFQ